MIAHCKRGFNPPSRPVAHCLLFGLLLFSAGCRRDMFQQPFEKPLEKSDLFKDNQMASRPVIPHTVPRDNLREDETFYTGKAGTNLVRTFPLSLTRELLLRGQERYGI